MTNLQLDWLILIHLFIHLRLSNFIIFIKIVIVLLISLFNCRF